MKPSLKPSRVLRLVKQGKLSRHIDGGRIKCQQCGKLHPKAATESPEFWENGSYVYCGHCKQQTLARPAFPKTEGYPQGFEIDLTGERKTYPVVMQP
jgi:hypothetical protein